MNASLPTAAPPPYRNVALDGLRGFAALAVTSGHLVVSLGLLPYQTGGFIGVLVFFTLSGYLITSMCWRSPAGWSAYGAFLRRRVRRLAGVIVALVVLGVPVMVAFGRQPFQDALMSGALALGQLTAFAIPLGVGDHPAWGPTWSLTVEWVFYLLLPLGLLATKRRAMSALSSRNAMILVAVGLYLLGLPLPPKAFYVLPVANLGVMVAGAALALTHIARAAAETRTRPEPARAMFAFVLLGIFVVLPQGQLGIGYKIVVLPAVTLATLVVLHGCREDSLISRLLATRALTAVGQRAYSLYLWHFPVFWIVWLSLPNASKYVHAVTMVGATALVVAVSYRFLEWPWLRTEALCRLEKPTERHQRVVSTDSGSARHFR